MAAQARLFTAGKLIIDPGMKSVDLPVRGFITMEMDGRQSLKLVKLAQAAYLPLYRY
jgi:hypothetical protein